MNWNDVLLALWIFLPAGLANATPVFASKLPVLKNWEYPVDFNKSFRGTRIFGKNKTVRGFVTGILIAILTAWLLQQWYLNDPVIRSALGFNFGSLNPVLFGFLSGFGGLTGDAIKSFFKRRTSIKPGESWFPFDQIDYIIGGIIFLLPYVRLSLLQYLLILILYFLLHLISTFIGFLLKLKDKPI